MGIYFSNQKPLITYMRGYQQVNKKCYFFLLPSEPKNGWQFRKPVGSFHHVTSPKAFLKLPAQRPSNLLRNQMQQIKYRLQLSIWGLCLPAERRGWVAQSWGWGWQRHSSREKSHMFSLKKRNSRSREHFTFLEGLHLTKMNYIGCPPQNAYTL